MGAHTTPDERHELVTRYRRRGLTQREFCDAEGITVGALRSWLYKRSSKRVEGRGSALRRIADLVVALYLPGEPRIAARGGPG